MIPTIFRKAQNKIQDPAKLKRLITLINGETWVGLDIDTKGEIYEGLLEKNAQDTKSGAGQYFTPRALIAAMVECVAPRPGETICDPACGTGGFFLAAFEYILRHHPNLDPDQKRHVRSGLFTGWEIVDNTARLCAMNLLLHGIESPDSDSPIRVDDALRADPGERFDMVLTNPPFGKKSSVQIVNAAGKVERQSLMVVRDDFWASTSNKQFNFVQHVKTLLKVGGTAAVVPPFCASVRARPASIVIALVLMASIREQTELADVPELATGMGIVLIIAGCLSLAFMGFAGLLST